MVAQNNQALSHTQQTGQAIFLANGRYTLFEVVASTALVTFYRATDTHTLEVDQSSSRVVVGIINPILKQVNGFSDALPRVLDEFSDPAITPYIEDHGSENDQYWYVLPDLRGTPLHSYINQTGRFGYPVPDTLDLIENILVTVRQSPLKKEFGYLEPGAIYYEAEDGQCTLLNSPVATTLNLVSQSNPGKELKRPTLHSGYLSPEVALGKNPTDYDDSFSLAAIAYQMLNGHLPFVNDHTVEAALKKTNPAAIAKLEPESSRVMLNALAFQREQRPANGEELLHQLQNPPALPKEPGSLSGWIKISGAAVLVFGITFSAFSYVNHHDGETPNQLASDNTGDSEEQRKITQLQQQYEQEAQKLAKLRQQQQEETQRLSELKHQQQQETQRLTTLKQQQKLAAMEAESKRLAEQQARELVLQAKKEKEAAKLLQEQQKKEKKAREAALKKQQELEGRLAELKEERKIAAQKKREAEERKIAAQKKREAEERKIAAQKKREAEERKIAAQKKREAEERKIAAQKKREAEERKIAAQKKREAEERKIAAQKKREAEERRIAVQKKREAEERRIAVQKKREAEERRIAWQKQQEAEERRIAWQKQQEAEERRIAWQKQQEAEERRIAWQKQQEAKERRIAWQKQQEAEKYPDPPPRLIRKVSPRFFNPRLFGKIPAGEQSQADQACRSIGGIEALGFHPKAVDLDDSVFSSYYCAFSNADLNTKRLIAAVPSKTSPRLEQKVSYNWINQQNFADIPAEMAIAGKRFCSRYGFKQAIKYHPRAIGTNGAPIQGGGYLCK